MTWDLPLPQVISKFFLDSNVIDIFNQACQFDLQLEKHWITYDGFFSPCNYLVWDCCYGLLERLLLPSSNKPLVDRVRDWGVCQTFGSLHNTYAYNHGSEERTLTIMEKRLQWRWTDINRRRYIRLRSTHHQARSNWLRCSSPWSL